MSSEEKTEEPTSHKLREARKRGEVAMSKELDTAASFAALLLGLWFMWSHLGDRLRRLFATAFDAMSRPLDTPALAAAASQMLVDMAWIVLPIFLIAAVSATFVGLIQTRGMVSAYPLRFNFDRMNPGTAFQRIFSSRQLLEVLKLLLKLFLLLGVMVWAFKKYMSPLATAMYVSPAAGASVGLDALGVMFSTAALAFLALALVDYGHQFFEFIKQQRMSKSERKREHRDNEGNPEIKAEQRNFRRELTENAGKGGMNRASVLVTNPTHYAVALYYEHGEVDLPLVVAKAEDEGALQLRREASALAIPILEYPPLARSLHASVPLGSSIKDEHLEAVAAVFRWVNSLKRGEQSAKPA